MPAVCRTMWLRTRRVFLHYRIPVRAETEKELFLWVWMQYNKKQRKICLCSRLSNNLRLR